MAFMAMAVEGMGRLSLSSSSAVAFSSAKTISSFREFSGLASVRKISSSSSCSTSSFSATSFAPIIPSRRGVIWSAPLRIEARQPTRKETTKVRHRRIRKKLNGTSERPRLAVFRSNKHLYAQVIDDTKQHTLAASSTLMKPVREDLEFSSGPTVDAAKKVGEQIAKACLEKGISMVAFDRGGFVYHGRIRALADAAREGGLSF